jgi:hypothetical protein
MKQRTVASALIVLMLWACGSPSGSDAGSKLKNVDRTPYFDYDAVEHYAVGISEQALFELEEKDRRTENEEALLGILWADQLQSLADSVLIPKLERVGFSRRDLATTQVEGLKRIFCARTHDDPVFAACIQIYRDVLIFREKGSVVGMAKICFTCGDSEIVGTDLSTEEFGQSGDLAVLKSILDGKDR